MSRGTFQTEVVPQGPSEVLIIASLGTGRRLGEARRG